jgi:multicomponent K+:H+ antiporter subunit E
MKLVPMPMMSLALFALWLLLNRSVGVGHVLLAVAVAVGMPLLCAPLRPRGGPMRQPRTLVRLVLVVGLDVVLSAMHVALGVLRARRRPPRSRFIVIPLDLRDAHALAALAVITTVVPGTVWSELAPDRSALMLHVFDVDDESGYILHFKERYERALREIFE